MLVRRIEAVQVVEEQDWWAFNVKDTKITPHEMQLLLDAFGADEVDREENTLTPEEGLVYDPNTSGLSMDFSLKIIRDLIPILSISTLAVDRTGMWVVDDVSLRPPKQNTLYLRLPDGRRLRTMVNPANEYPSITVALEGEDNSYEEILCFAEWNQERKAGCELCVCAYADDEDEPAYYESYKKEKKKNAEEHD